jgi:hypothetical protein
MIPRRFLSIASALSFFSQACSAQTITLTTHVSACSATYTSGTSTTVIQSTVTVQPTPWTDAAANGGAPFVVRLQQVDVSGYPDQDTAPYWLTANGNTTTNSPLAAVYTINEGRLATLNGSHVATNFNVVDQAFGVTDYDLPINTTFSVNNRMLNWTNALFTNGTAQFYKLPPGLLDNALILAKFLGPMEAQRSWSPVILYVEPLIDNGTGVVSSSTASGASGAQLSTVSNLFPSGGSSSIASGSGVAASSSAAAIGSSIASKLSSQLSSVASSASSVSSMASMSSVMASRMSSISAPSMMESMASSSAASVLSSIAAGASSPLAGGSSSAAGSASTSLASVSGIGPVVVPSSSTSSSAAATSSMPPQTTYSCPVNNNEMVQSNMGGMYQIGCNDALSGGGAQLAGSATTFNGCMTICDQTDGCTAWTYDGVSSCYIKTGTTSSGVTFQPSATQGTVSGIRNVPARPGSVGSASSSSSMASSSSVLSASSSGSTLSSSISSAVKSVSSAVQPVSSALSAGSSSVIAVSSSIAPVLSSAGVPSSATSMLSSAGAASSTSNAPGAATSGSLSTASSVAPPSSSALASSSTQPTSSAASAAASQIAYSCPSANNQTVIDPNGVGYLIGCGSDSSYNGIVGGHPPDFNGCMIMCDQAAGCGGWTWVNTQTCYLKITDASTLTFVPASADYVSGIRNGSAGGSSSTPSTTSAAAGASNTAYSCPSVNNQTVPDPNGVEYHIDCDSDTSYGGTPGGASPDFNGCMPMCDNTSGCGGWTWTTNGNCYLKITDASTLTFVPAAAGIVAGIKYVPAVTTAPSGNGPPTCPSMNGTTIMDARGASYSVVCAQDGQGFLIDTVDVNGDGINECFAACDNTPNCGAFTYSGDSTMTKGTCYLKENAGDQTTDGVADTIAEAILVSPANIAAPSSSSTSSAAVISSPAPITSTGAGTGTGSSGTGTGSGSGSAASSSSSSSYTPACTGPPLPSGSGNPTVINPDGSTSNYTGVLANPTRCDFGDPIDTEEDDSYCEIDLPFNMNIYGGSSAHTFASTNGVSSSLDLCS